MGSSSEKALLPSPSSPATTPRPHFLIIHRRLIASVFSILFIIRYILVPIYIPSWRIIRITYDDTTNLRSSCEQAEPIFPQAFDVSSLVQGEEEQIRDWLSGAVRVPTEIFDVMGEIGEDPRWDAFYKFADCALFRLNTLA